MKNGTYNYTWHSKDDSSDAFYQSATLSVQVSDGSKDEFGKDNVTVTLINAVGIKPKLDKIDSPAPKIISVSGKPDILIPELADYLNFVTTELFVNDVKIEDTVKGVEFTFEKVKLDKEQNKIAARYVVVLESLRIEGSLSDSVFVDSDTKPPEVVIKIPDKDNAVLTDTRSSLSATISFRLLDKR